MEEEEKEFANLNEGEEKKAETGQDEGKTETQKNRMEGRSEAKAGGDTKGREVGGEPHSTAPASTMLSAGCCERAGMGGKERASSSSGWCQRIIPHCCCELVSSRGGTDLVLRIRGCQLQMNHSLHLPNRIHPETE